MGITPGTSGVVVATLHLPDSDSIGDTPIAIRLAHDIEDFHGED